jgi:hypothetical protein
LADRNQQFGDGSDNYGQAAKNLANAGKQFGQAGAQAASKGAEVGAQAAANAAAASVKAGVETGKAVAQIASGTAAGGPWGAAIMAAWSMRHTLYKVLIFICLLLMFLVSMVVMLPAIIFNSIFRTDPATVDTAASTCMYEQFEELSGIVADSVTAGYDYAMAEVERIIAVGSYDHTHSMQALINHGLNSADYDVCYVLSAYSMSMEQRGTTRQDMIDKLDAVKAQMFPVTYVVKQTTITIPPADENSEPTTQTITYAECTIHPFVHSVILTAFSIDTSAQYGQFNITCGQAIDNMAMALKLTMFGSITGGSVPPITDAELAAFLANLNCSPDRKKLMEAALSLVGRVPYFWGGKSPAGWNDEWNTPKQVTAAGSSSTGTIRPFGLDCSGFTDWAYKTAYGVSISAGSANQWANSTSITQAQLLPGDLGFKAVPGTVSVNHVLIYAGKDASGNLMWVHCAGGVGVILDSPGYVKYFRRPNGVNFGG